VRPAIALEDADGKTGVEEAAVRGIVVGNGGDSAEQVLEAADEAAIFQGVGSEGAEGFVVKAGIHVLAPEVGIGVTVAELRAGVMVEFEVVMGVDAAGSEDAAFKVNFQGVGRGFGKDGRAQVEVAVDEVIADRNDCAAKGE
jgi:hypothetical protein